MLLILGFCLILSLSTNFLLKKKKRVNNIKWTLWMFYILYVIKTQHINSDLGLTYTETLKNLFPAHL